MKFWNIFFIFVFLTQLAKGQDFGFGLNLNFINDAVSFFNENLNPFQNSALTNLVRGALSFGGNSNIIGRAANFIGELSCATIKIQFGMFWSNIQVIFAAVS